MVVWAVTGPMFGFSDTWQLVINTGTTIVTFLMVFLIQNTQNRDTAAIQIKLDELIRAIEGAHNALLDLEEMEDCDLERIRRDYEALATAARRGAAEERRPILLQAQRATLIRCVPSNDDRQNRHSPHAPPARLARRNKLGFLCGKLSQVLGAIVGLLFSRRSRLLLFVCEAVCRRRRR